MQVDYSPHLNRIITALSKPDLPTWAVALVAALSGAVLTLGAQWLLKILDDWRELRKLRRMLYSDAVSIYSTVRDVLEEAPKKMEGFALYSFQERELRESLTFETEKYLNGACQQE